ncbi:MAG: dihydrolipoamide acetyltransferase family protein [Armatimonadota bacterium]
MTQITMPKLSDTMEEGKVSRWLKHEGDTVTEGEPIAEIETDKANVEMEAFEPGVISHIIAKEGDTIPVGEPIAELTSPETASAPEAPTAEVRPQETPYIPSTKAPEPNTTDQVPLATAPPPPEAVAESPKPEVKPEVHEEPQEEERIIASPLARKMAEENRIDLKEVQGSGPGGRIVESDIESYMGKTENLEEPKSPPQTKAEKPREPSTPAVETSSVEIEMSRMRKTIAERMSMSKQTVPHFYINMDIEMDWASRVRDELNSDDEQPKISFTDLIIKACALALNAHSEVNRSYKDGKMYQHKEVNIGIAVALDEGLLVPVLHNADKKPLRQISVETRELAKRARENSLHMSDISGAVFTISNLGMFDVESFISIINPPESASLAVGTIREIPIVINDQITVSKRMKATLSADHRVLDGAVAAKFMQDVKRRLESPISLLQCA